MTSPNVIREVQSDGRIKYRYVFEPIGNIVEKYGLFESYVEKTTDALEAHFVKSLIYTIKTFNDQAKVIIGLGPGRCGTMSLAMILSAQTHVTAHHESEPGLDWDSDIYTFIGKWSGLLFRVKPRTPYLADVANWYLPFVPIIMDIHSDVRFVCIRRDAEEVVASFMNKVATTSHWTHRHSEHWNQYWERGHYFRKRFPQYDLPKEEGCRRYVKEYYEKCEEYEKLMPKNFRIFDIEDMNSHKGVKSILKFCGIPEEEMEIAEVCGTHINKTADSHIEIVKDFKEQFGEDF